jgi:hypothetical protein
MAWTIDRIEAEWLAGPSGLAMSNSELVGLFELVESTFGGDWLESSREPPGSTGQLPTLHVAIAGALIRAVDGLTGRDHVLERLRADEPGVRTELLAVAAIRRAHPEIEIALEPIVAVGERTRAPDFRLRLDETDVFVEVSSPQRSDAFHEANQIAQQLAAAALQATPAGCSAEIYLHGTPDESAVAWMLDTVSRLSRLGGERVEKGDVANVVVNHSAPLSIEPFDHGDEARPRIGVAQLEWRGDDSRHALVRLPFTDERAARMLRQEARQLPVEAPGVVVLQVSGATTSLVAWQTLLKPRLHPGQHTRVSAIVLLQSGIASQAEGEAWVHQMKLIENEHARHACPDWALGPFRAWDDGQSHALP